MPSTPGTPGFPRSTSSTLGFTIPLIWLSAALVPAEAGGTPPLLRPPAGAAGGSGPDAGGGEFLVEASAVRRTTRSGLEEARDAEGRPR
jgi:hypothetical protein